MAKEEMIHRPYGLVSESQLAEGDELLAEIRVLWAREVRSHNALRGARWKGALQSFSGAFNPSSFADGGVWLFLEKKKGKPVWERYFNFYSVDAHIDNEMDEGHVAFDQAVYNVAETVFSEFLEEFAEGKTHEEGEHGWVKYRGKNAGTSRSMLDG